MAKPKTIKVEFNWEDIATVMEEWHEKKVSKKEAEQIISHIKGKAEDLIGHEGFQIISELIAQG